MLLFFSGLWSRYIDKIAHIPNTIACWLLDETSGTSYRDVVNGLTAFMATNNTTMLTLNTPVSAPPTMANLAASAIALSEKAAQPASEAKS